MALPPERATPKLERLQTIVNAASEATLAAFPPLTEAELVLIGSYIHTFNYIELSLRRCLECLALAGLLGKDLEKKYPDLRPAQLIDAIKVAVVGMDRALEDIPDTISQLDEIELRRRHRNLFGHWAVRRFPNDDAVLFLSKDNVDAKQNGGPLKPGSAATCIMDLADVRGLVAHVIPLEQWVSAKFEEWYRRYHGD